MKIEQLYTNCLAEAAYYIESNGEAAIIDPIRETEPYVAKLKAAGAKLKYVFETHFHADFVSGHIDLAKKTGAEIVYGPLAETGYKARNAKDGEIFTVGALKIKVLHTPGHTPESSCFLLLDEKGKEHCLFTGDTLFIGDVGRPDLLDGKMSKEELAGMLYESLNNKVKTLPDDVIIYPAHGAGSACGKNISKETWSTLGEQKKSNYALQPMDKETFIKSVTDGLTAPPAYFFKDAMINKNGYESIDDVMQRNTKALSAADVKKEMANGALVLDTRHPDEFEKGFIPGAINIGLDGGPYAVWLGTVVDITKPLVIVAPEGREDEAVLRCARVGFENVRGVLKGGIAAWASAGEKVETVTSITAEDFAKKVGSEIVLDVRKPGEYESGHVQGAQHLELADLEKNLSQLDKNKNYLIHCAGGYRSMIASSILKAHGFTRITNVYGGYNKIKNSGVKIENSMPQTA